MDILSDAQGEDFKRLGRPWEIPWKRIIPSRERGDGSSND